MATRKAAHLFESRRGRHARGLLHLNNHHGHAAGDAALAVTGEPARDVLGVLSHRTLTELSEFCRVPTDWCDPAR
ncbi:hypothetical protein ACIRS3_34990 [Streptomyces virginiae]|uniref:hypothetical protein n=1 Tax=Streptomyces virginiae TaxID=1961 RepID=UPI0038122661